MSVRTPRKSDVLMLLALIVVGGLILVFVVFRHGGVDSTAQAQPSSNSSTSASPSGSAKQPTASPAANQVPDQEILKSKALLAVKAYYLVLPGDTPTSRRKRLAKVVPKTVLNQELYYEIVHGTPDKAAKLQPGQEWRGIVAAEPQLRTLEDDHGKPDPTSQQVVIPAKAGIYDTTDVKLVRSTASITTTSTWQFDSHSRSWVMMDFSEGGDS